MLRTDTEYVEWLINRFLKKGEPRKMKRALNASLRRTRLTGQFERVAEIRKQIRVVIHNARKYRKYMAKTYPGGTASVKITDDGKEPTVNPIANVEEL